MTELNDLAAPTEAGVARFMQVLEDLRVSQPPEAWRTMAKNHPILRRWRFFLSADPYTRWGLLKPRGYPGDATLMDFAYGHPSVQPEIAEAGRLGALIYESTAGATQSESARQRIELIAREIEDRAGLGHAARIVSVASGHARELETISESARQHITEFVAIDADPVSLQEAERSAGAIRFVPIHKNVLKADLTPLGQADLVYSLGLFDYLNKDHATAVLAALWRMTAPGGTAIVANLAPTAANLAYCEGIMDWWMTVRSSDDMQALADGVQADFGDVAQCSVRQVGCFFYLKLNKQ